MPLLVWICALALPVAGSSLILAGSRHLSGRVPGSVPSNGVRSDIHLARAAYVEMIVGLTILFVWSLAVAAVGTTMALRIVVHNY